MKWPKIIENNGAYFIEDKAYFQSDTWRDWWKRITKKKLENDVMIKFSGYVENGSNCFFNVIDANWT